MTVVVMLLDLKLMQEHQTLLHTRQVQLQAIVFLKLELNQLMVITLPEELTRLVFGKKY